ncbi:MAG: hypothetical protein ACFFAH_14930 [Promethearchaeota archaeon]
MGAGFAYNLKHAKKIVKTLRKIANLEEKGLNFKIAVKHYKKALKISEIWNLKNLKNKILREISKLNYFILKIELENQIKTAEKLEKDCQYNVAQKHYKIAKDTAVEINSMYLEDIPELIDFLRQKIEKCENIKLNQISMYLYNKKESNNPVDLPNALKMVHNLPSSIDEFDNFISFENLDKKKIFFHRISDNIWYMEISYYNDIFYHSSIKHKYLTTDLVKIIVINFFKGNFIGDLLTQNKDKNILQRELIKLKVEIEKIIKKLLICQFCNNKITHIEIFECNSCGAKINLNDFLFSNIFKTISLKLEPD